jgi:hypothetical protein
MNSSHSLSSCVVSTSPFPSLSTWVRGTLIAVLSTAAVACADPSGAEDGKAPEEQSSALQGSKCDTIGNASEKKAATSGKSPTEAEKAGRADQKATFLLMCKALPPVPGLVRFACETSCTKDWNGLPPISRVGLLKMPDGLRQYQYGRTQYGVACLKECESF